MTVSIDIDLSAGDVHRELIRLKAEIEALEDSFDLDFDGNLGKKLSELGDALDDLTDGLTDDLDDSIDRLENLNIDPITVEGGGDSGGGTGSDSGDFDPQERYGWNRPGAHLKESEIIERVKTSDYGTTFSDVESRFSSEEGWVRGNGIPSVDFDVGDDDGQSLSDLVDIPEGRDISNRIDGWKNPVRKIIPSMQTWWNIIGALIPALGAAAVQASGLAASMLSVAGAGAAVVGLGLLGEGDTMAQSFQNAKSELQDLKREVFETFQPTAQQFSGTSSRFLDFAPGQLDRVAESMEGLTAYEDTIFSTFRGITQFGSDMVDVIVSNEQAVSQLSTRFGSLLGSSIIDLFSGLISEAYANQNTLVELGNIFKLIALTIYNLFKAISTAMVMLSPFFEILHWLSTLLNGSLIFGLLTAVAVFGMFAYGAIGAASSIATLASTISAGLIPGISAAFGMLQAYTFEALMATTASYALAQSIATVIATATLLAGAGLAVWAGLQAAKGMKQVNQLRNEMGDSNIPSANGGGGGGTVNNINYQMTFQGDPDEASVQGMKDVVKDENYRHVTRQPPNVGDE